MILKTAVSHRGTESTEAAAKERHLQKVLKNGYPRGEDKASEKAPASPLALCSLEAVSQLQLRGNSNCRI